MSDITFHCPHCNQQLEAPPEMAGTEIICPACNEQFTAPKGFGGQTEAAACPGCGAQLAADAVLCIQCGFDTRSGKKIETDLEA